MSAPPAGLDDLAGVIAATTVPTVLLPTPFVRDLVQYVAALQLKHAATGEPADAAEATRTVAPGIDKRIVVRTPDTLALRLADELDRQLRRPSIKSDLALSNVMLCARDYLRQQPMEQTPIDRLLDGLRQWRWRTHGTSRALHLAECVSADDLMTFRELIDAALGGKLPG